MLNEILLKHLKDPRKPEVPVKEPPRDPRKPAHPPVKEPPEDPRQDERDHPDKYV